MTYSKLFKVTDTQVIITLPDTFKNKEVWVTVDTIPPANTDKMAQMRLAVRDPLFLSDLKEVYDDFKL